MLSLQKSHWDFCGLGAVLVTEAVICPDPKMLVSKLRTKSFLWLFSWDDPVLLWRGLMIKKDVFFSAWEGTGPVNLALWQVTMTRGFTGHKPRGMRECRKWATVSIFCQTALRLLLPLHSLCVYACNWYPLLQFIFPIEVMWLVSEALSSSLTFTLACISCQWFWLAQIQTPPRRLTALFLEIVWNCRIKGRSRRQHLETREALRRQQSGMAASLWLLLAYRVTIINAGLFTL